MTQGRPAQQARPIGHFPEAVIVLLFQPRHRPFDDPLHSGLSGVTALAR
jgi:hypothetical protein